MNFRLERDAFGHIVLIDAQGVRHGSPVDHREDTGIDKF